MERLSVRERERIAELVAEGAPLPWRLRQEVPRSRYAIYRAVRRLLRPPAPEPTRSALRLSLAEREEIWRGLARGESPRGIARRLGRSPSTVSREVARNGGRGGYRACQADRAALRLMRRPKVAKLARCARLRAVVEAKLELRWSLQQIAGWLSVEFPHDAEMRVSETIYLSLFVQSRGARRTELTRYLRVRHSARRRGSFADGAAVLVLGGDCTVELGTVVAGALVESDSVGLVYVDLDVGARGAAEVRRRLCDLDLSDMSRVRAGLHHRFAVELALGLEAAGRAEGGELLEALGPRGRQEVRAEAATRTHRAKLAKSLLVAVPAPPADRTEIAVLGPLALARTGEPVTDRDLRRERVRALLAFLVGYRTTSRAAIMAAVWPDLHERAAANNLRVTMTYLLRVLEPGRPAREPAYHIRVDGPTVTLVTSDWLQIDVDRFNEHVTRAARAEADGTPSLALEHNLAAAALYRGEAHEGVADADWIPLEREHFRVRFVAAATRAAELLVGRGDVDEAERLARRAVEIDPWAEDAYAVLVSVALARGDRSAARRTLNRTLAALVDLGVEPSEETRRLRRRLRGGTGDTD